jgi:hypothetical protein
LQEKPSAIKRVQPALQNLKFLSFFLFLWVIFAFLDPDLDLKKLSTMYARVLHANSSFLRSPSPRFMCYIDIFRLGNLFFWKIVPDTDTILTPGLSGTDAHAQHAYQKLNGA